MFHQPVLPGFGRGRGFINDVSFGRGRGRGRGRGVVIDRRFGFTPIEQLVDTRKSKPLVLTKDQVIEKKPSEQTYIDITKPLKNTYRLLTLLITNFIVYADYPRFQKSFTKYSKKNLFGNNYMKTRVSLISIITNFQNFPKLMKVKP